MSPLPAGGASRAALAALVPVVTAACGARVASPPADPPPNVLLISIDTLRADHLGCYGYGPDTSPAIDRLAAGGVLFERAEASSSWTLPGLASILTGEYSSTTGCWTFASRLRSGHATLAERLLARGYDTASITTNLFTARPYGLQQGFVWSDDGSFRTEDGPLEDSITSPRISDGGIAYLEAKAASKDGWPWFLWLHYLDPHDAYEPHAGFTERFLPEDTTDALRRDLDLYDGEIAFTDHHIGRVLDTLERLGLADSTIVVLVADHGEEFEDHGSRYHGHTLHRELTRVPLIVRAPGFSPRRVASVVRTVDLVPTLLDLTGDPPADGLPGRSLRPFLRGEDPAPLPALSELRLHPFASYDSVRTERWTLVRPLFGEDPPALYDAVGDPEEHVDVAADHPDVVSDLLAEMEALERAAEARSERFGGPNEVDLSSDQLDAIRRLGYAGER